MYFPDNTADVRLDYDPLPIPPPATQPTFTVQNRTSDARGIVSIKQKNKVLQSEAVRLFFGNKLKLPISERSRYKARRTYRMKFEVFHWQVLLETFGSQLAQGESLASFCSASIVNCCSSTLQTSSLRGER
ncbi:unnamed protein product [Gongylonema pulchrum]|uniref:Uncharacterized protein n=1 Tax=Gongylonema pulchrum TaxID=637853 RepID=A0A183CZY0_9BILA|nr:unnamed protein product [Gongylonema pulchrum]